MRVIKCLYDVGGGMICRRDDRRRILLVVFSMEVASYWNYTIILYLIWRKQVRVEVLVFFGIM